MIPGRVSVVMPCYNVARYVDAAIESLRNQTYKNIEVIAVNDGSTDDTMERLKRQAEADARVRVFHRANGGPSAARNLGIRHVTGAFVCFLDGDDVYLPNKIERQVRFLDQHPGVDLVYSDFFFGDADLAPVDLTAPRVPYTDMVEAMAMRNWIGVHATLFRRTMMDAVGEFDESFRMAEDWDYWIRCAKVGAFGYLPGAMTIYRTHPGQAHHNIDRMFEAGKRVLRKHFKSDPALYQRALAAWYARSAKARWAAEQHVKTGVCLAFSAFHNKVAGALARLGHAR
jgi:glycosyltransferase involved in cell wall biosynthesis